MANCAVCLLGGPSKHNILYGGWMSSEQVNVHYFCLLSGRNIFQRGTDSQGILGFMPRDILRSTDSFRNNQCLFCGLFSAAVYCSYEGCTRTWHYSCGTRNKCMTVMKDNFESYCGLHVPDLNGGKKYEEYVSCSVCISRLGPYNPADSIISSCCLKVHDWYCCFNHKKCVLEYTKNAGYDSMCINCSMVDGPTKEEWQDEMRQKGVFIPMSAAAWEKDGRFDNQVKNKCEDPNCPQRNSTKNVWTCFVCGCFPRHLSCAKVESSDEYYCPNCYDQSFVQRVPRY